MPRPQNTALKEQIERASWDLFCEVGYSKASYSAIAERCGISRNLVQYHFKKKELLATAFMERLLSQVREELGYSEEDLEGNIEAIHRIGAGFFSFLMEDEGRRAFLKDILSSRDLTETILAFDAGWALDHMGLRNPDTERAVMRSVVYHMGGFYELLYYCLSEGEPFDAGAELVPVLRSFAEATGCELRQPAAG